MENLKLEPVLKKMLKDTSTEQHIMSVSDKEQRIDRFIEWLKLKPTKEYNKFVEILYKTDQSQVATQLLKSCMYDPTMLKTISFLQLAFIYLDNGYAWHHIFLLFK